MKVATEMGPAAYHNGKSQLNSSRLRKAQILLLTLIESAMISASVFFEPPLPVTPSPLTDSCTTAAAGVALS